MSHHGASFQMPASRPSLRGIWGSLSRHFDIDRATLFALATRAWQIIAVPVTLLLITRRFSAEVQGFHYTFASLLALQVFAELGFYIVIVSFASHEWARLSLDERGRIIGDEGALSRLVGLGRLVFKWYAAGGALFVIGVGTAGYVFLSLRPDAGVRWLAPWLALVTITGLAFWTLPFTSLLEGCGQVTAVNRLRLLQTVVASLAAWVAIEVGCNLWTAVILAAVSLFLSLRFLLVRFHNFFEPFFSRPSGARIDWRSEVWPMQSRLALQGLVNYFTYSLFTPVMFYYHGPAVAGQMGMTWQVILGVQSVSQAWIQTRTPVFGALVARREFGALDRLWSRASRISLAVMAGGGAAAWLVISGLRAWGVPLAGRLLAPWPTALLVAAGVLSQIVQCEAAYLRAHRRELFAAAGTVSSVLTGLLVWALGRRLGPTGAALGYLLVLACVTAPWATSIWFRARDTWHET